jgi:peptidoglycan/LPS O-acetylase OafA/YrhL
MVIVLSARHVPESRDPGAADKTDYLGAAAVVVFLSGITFAFIEAPALGWERHAASPMLPRATRRSAPGWPCCH